MKMKVGMTARGVRYPDEYARWTHGILHGFTVDYETCSTCNPKPKRKPKGGGRR